MRISRLHLHNFRIYVDTKVDLDRVTIFTGPNDGGKSTLVDALRSLFVDTDRFGRIMSWELVRHVGAGTPRESPFDTVVRETSGGKLEGTPTHVLAFLEIAQDDESGWGLLTPNPTFGAYWPVGSPSPTRCLVVTADLFRAKFGDPQSWTDWLSQVRIAEDEHGWWLDFDDARSALSSILQSDLWPPLDDGSLVHVPGPDVPAPGAADILRPLITRRIIDEMANEDDAWAFARAGYRGLAMPDEAKLRDAIEAAKGRIRDAFGDVLEDYAPSIQLTDITAAGEAPSFQEVVSRLLRRIEVTVLQDGVAHALDEMGAGTRRAATMAAVELYTRPDLVHLEIPVAYIVLEEPEVGLHAAAQHRVAYALKRAASVTPHVQLFVITHSPVFLDMFESSWIRICRPAPEDPASRVIQTTLSLESITAELGISPRDALMASHVLLVEGDSDAAILSIWSIANGASLDAARVAVVPARGTGHVEQIARVLSLVYGTVGITVLLDNGADTNRLRMTLRERYGERIHIHLLSETEIEGYFPERAVAEWATNRGASPESVEAALQVTVKMPAKKRLREIATRLGFPEYQVRVDGVAIASLMREEEIRPEMRALLTDIVASAWSGVPPNRG